MQKQSRVAELVHGGSRSAQDGRHGASGDFPPSKDAERGPEALNKGRSELPAIGCNAMDGWTRSPAFPTEDANPCNAFGWTAPKVASAAQGLMTESLKRKQCQVRIVLRSVSLNKKG